MYSLLLGCGLRWLDKVMGSLDDVDVHVSVSKELFGRCWGLLKDGPREDLITRSPVEVLDHHHVRDVEDTIPHGLEMLEE